MWYLTYQSIDAETDVTTIRELNYWKFIPFLYEMCLFSKSQLNKLNVESFLGSVTLSAYILKISFLVLPGGFSPLI